VQAALPLAPCSPSKSRITAIQDNAPAATARGIFFAAANPDQSYNRRAIEAPSVFDYNNLRPEQRS